MSLPFFSVVKTDLENDEQIGLTALVVPSGDSREGYLRRAEKMIQSLLVQSGEYPQTLIHHGIITIYRPPTIINKTFLFLLVQPECQMNLKQWLDTEGLMDDLFALRLYREAVN